jgi:hypothetical protein
MIGIRVVADLREVEKYANDVRRNRVPRAAGAALQKTARSVTKTADQEIRQRWALSSAVVKKALTTERYNNRLMVAVVATGSPIPLRDYQARMTKMGATFRVVKAGGRKLYKRLGNAGFIIDRFGGHVFVRIEPDPPGPRKGRIKTVYGPSITHYFVSRFIRTRMDATANETWPKRFAEELNYQFNVRK